MRLQLRSHGLVAGALVVCIAAAAPAGAPAAEGAETAEWQGGWPIMAVWAAPGAKEVFVMEDRRLSVFAFPGGKKVRERTDIAYHTAAAFSADGRYALIASPRTQPRLLNLKTDKDERTFAIEEDLVQSAALSPDGSLACVAARGVVYAWRTAGGELVCKFRLQPDWSDMAFAPSARFGLNFGCTSGPSDVKLYDLNSGKQLVLFRTNLTALRGQVALSPDGNSAAALSSGAVHYWACGPAKPDAGREREVIPAPKPGAYMRVAFSPDGRLVAAVGSRAAALYWCDCGTDMYLAYNLPGLPACVTFSADQSHLIIACNSLPPPCAAPPAPGGKAVAVSGDPFSRLHVIALAKSGVPLLAAGDAAGAKEGAPKAGPPVSPGETSKTGEHETPRPDLVEAAMKLGAQRWMEQVKGWDAKRRGPPRCLSVPPSVTRAKDGWQIIFEDGMNRPAGGTRVALVLDDQGREVAPAQCTWAAK